MRRRRVQAASAAITPNDAGSGTLASPLAPDPLAQMIPLACAVPTHTPSRRGLSRNGFTAAQFGTLRFVVSFSYHRFCFPSKSFFSCCIASGFIEFR